MKIAVLFDGAGLARLGLEQAGHECTGVELDPVKHELGRMVGSGNTVLGDAREFDLTGYDAVWASPPCQERSNARTSGPAGHRDLDWISMQDCYYKDHLDWCLALSTPILWVENVWVPSEVAFGPLYNAAQFTDPPLQNRNRIIAGRYIEPKVYRSHSFVFRGVCPTVTATEYRGGRYDTRRAARFYGRKMTIDECAYHQGFTIPEGWRKKPLVYWGTDKQWLYHQYIAIGNGVPVYMARAFGEAYGRTI